MPIFIKGMHIDGGMPKICVPIVAQKKDDIIEEARRLVVSKSPMLEWRIDCFAEYTDGEAVRDVLEELREITVRTPLIATVRSKEEGGEADLSGEERFLLYEEIAKAHVADIIDVEAFAEGDVPKLLATLHLHGALVLLSHHDFHGTPETKEIEEDFKRMALLDGDLVKIAVMPKDICDTLRLMEAAAEFHKKHADVPMVAIAMGKMGALSRISGELYGSCITFATGGEQSAPGQLSAITTEEALSFVHRLEEGK